MRSLLVYLLVFAVLLPGISSWGILAHYQLNKQYIARVLCENRDKPQLHCDGTCYLAKQLKAQQDRQDKETTRRVQNMPSIQLFFEGNLRFEFNPSFYYLPAARSVSYVDQVCLPALDGLFRPPRA